MSASFSRSIRTMQSDTSGGSIVSLVVVIVLLGGWLGWSLLVRVPVYAVSDTAELLNSTQAIAHFPPDALLRVRSGQPALLRLDDFAWDEFGAVAATVVRVDDVLQDGRIRVELHLEPEADTVVPLQAGLTGRAEIKVDQKSPVSILLETTDQRLTGRVNTSGQK